MITAEPHQSLWETWNEKGGPRYPHNKVVQFCFRHYPPEVRKDTNVLDLACGSGVHTVFLAKEGFRVTGTDISETGIENTRRTLVAQGLSADLRVESVDSISFPTAFFDLVICIGVYECVGPKVAEQSVARVKDVLKKGGRGLLLFAGESDFRLKGDNPYHLHGFSEAEVGFLFSQDFSEVFVDRYITTYQGGLIQQFDWLVTVMK